MRSPVGELVAAGSRALTRARTVRNDAAVPYVGRGGRYSGGAGPSSVTGDQAEALEAPGINGTLFAIQNQLSTGVAAIDWHLHRTGMPTTTTCEQDDCGQAGVELVTTHSALSVWNQPNDFFTSMLFTETFQQHLDLVGEAWWVVAYLAGRPIELWPVRPDRMAPVRDAKKFIAGYVYRSPDGQMIPLRLDEVVMLRVPAPWDPYRGAGAVQTLMSNIYGARYASEWNRRFFENSAIPGGIVEMPVHLQEHEWNEFQNRWAESHKGASNAHTVAMLEYGAKWIDVKYTQKDMEFPELRRVTREEIREAFAMHGQILGLSENVNRANAEAGEYGFGKRHLLPRAERIRDALNGPFLKLFKTFGKGFEFAYSNPVPEDREGNNAERLSKAQSFATLVTAGVDADDAAMVCGLPKMRFKKPEPRVIAPPGGGRADDDADAAA